MRPIKEGPPKGDPKPHKRERKCDIIIMPITITGLLYHENKELA